MSAFLWLTRLAGQEQPNLFSCHLIAIIIQLERMLASSLVYNVLLSTLMAANELRPASWRDKVMNGDGREDVKLKVDIVDDEID